MGWLNDLFYTLFNFYMGLTRLTLLLPFTILSAWRITKTYQPNFLGEDDEEYDDEYRGDTTDEEFESKLALSEYGMDSSFEHDPVRFESTQDLRRIDSPEEDDEPFDPPYYLDDTDAYPEPVKPAPPARRFSWMSIFGLGWFQRQQEEQPISVEKKVGYTSEDLVEDSLGEEDEIEDAEMVDYPQQDEQEEEEEDDIGFDQGDEIIYVPEEDAAFMREEDELSILEDDLEEEDEEGVDDRVSQVIPVTSPDDQKPKQVKSMITRWNKHVEQKEALRKQSFRVTKKTSPKRAGKLSPKNSFRRGVVSPVSSFRRSPRVRSPFETITPRPSRKIKSPRGSYHKLKRKPAGKLAHLTAQFEARTDSTEDNAEAGTMLVSSPEPGASEDTKRQSVRKFAKKNLPPISPGPLKSPKSPGPLKSPLLLKSPKSPLSLKSPKSPLPLKSPKSPGPLRSPRTPKSPGVFTLPKSPRTPTSPTSPFSGGGKLSKSSKSDSKKPTIVSGKESPASRFKFGAAASTSSILPTASAIAAAAAAAAARRGICPPRSPVLEVNTEAPVVSKLREQFEASSQSDDNLGASSDSQTNTVEESVPQTDSQDKILGTSTPLEIEKIVSNQNTWIQDSSQKLEQLEKSVEKLTSLFLHGSKDVPPTAEKDSASPDEAEPNLDSANPTMGDPLEDAQVASGAGNRTPEQQLEGKRSATPNELPQEDPSEIIEVLESVEIENDVKAAPSKTSEKRGNLSKIKSKIFPKKALSSSQESLISEPGVGQNQPEEQDTTGHSTECTIDESGDPTNSSACSCSKEVSNGGKKAKDSSTSSRPREFISSIFKERVLRDFWAVTRREEDFLRERGQMEPRDHFFSLESPVYSGSDQSSASDTD